MGKNRSASGLTNVIQYDNNGNIAFVSGSTTLMQVSSSGAITTTGVISGSNALSASFSLNSALLNGTGSVGFATTASLLTVSSSQQQISASLLQVSASLLTLTASFNAVSSSQQEISSSYIALSASYNTFSGSASTRITENSSSIQQVSASQQQISSSLLNVISVFATTGSNSFRATQSITGSLTVTGQIIAQTLNVQQVTSSIIYSSGSNNFGCDLNSRQTFTGSVLITGSLTIAGASSATSYSGTTIYGSTAVCSAVGKFTTCIDAGSGTFSGGVTAAGGTTITSANAQTTLNLNNTNACATIASAIYFNKNGTPKWGIGTDVYSNTGANEIQIYDFTNDLIRAKFTTSGANIIGTLGVTCAAAFCSTITGTTIYGSTAVCSPVGKFTSCVDAGTGTFSSSVTAASFEVGNGQYYAARRSSGNLLINLLGIESGTDNTRLVSTGDFNIVNGGLSSQFKIASTGVATFACSVGIGGAPTYPLEVIANIADWGFVTQNSNANGYGAFIKGGKSDGTTSALQVNNQAGTGLFTIKGNGRVGIGTDSPAAHLEIKGTNTYNKVAACFFGLYSSGFAFSDYNSGITYDAGGNTMCLYSNYTGYGGIVLSTCGSPRVFVNVAGNVGIGSTNPSNILEIVKDQTATTTLYIQNTSDLANAATEIRLYGNEGIAPLKNAQQISFVRGSGGADWALGQPANSNDFVIAGGTNQGDGKPSLTTAERIRITSAGIACFGYTVCAPCFATISDYRMKSNVRPIAGLSIIMNTKPYKFEYNYDCSTSFGMIAHELQDILPEAVFGYKDGEVMQGVDYMKLLPIAIKAIQEQQCIINMLKTCLGIA